MLVVGKCGGWERKEMGGKWCVLRVFYGEIFGGDSECGRVAGFVFETISESGRGRRCDLRVCPRNGARTTARMHRTFCILQYPTAVVSPCDLQAPRHAATSWMPLIYPAAVPSACQVERCPWVAKMFLAMGV